jgi:hypothetical protein
LSRAAKLSAEKLAIAFIVPQAIGSRSIALFVNNTSICRYCHFGGGSTERINLIQSA